MQITATLNYDYGYIGISLSLSTSDGSPQELYLLRYTNEDTLSTAELIAVLTPVQYGLYKDTMIEQGERYKYVICDSITSLENGAKTQDWVYSDFEDIFLSDQDRTLRIRFNPQISSFKNIIQEQKIETIGSRFPFFFRNGQLCYREIPISGLISTEMDDSFLSEVESQRTSALHVEQVSARSQREIYYNERKYREQVEAWLNNGKPKVFRSPTEGNYILRLTGVSLTPNQQLSRRLYTFNATGYEIAEYNTRNLATYGFLPVDDWYQVGEVAGEGVLGKVRGSNDLGSVTSVGTDGQYLEINNVNLNNVVGNTDLEVGGYDPNQVSTFSLPRATTSSSEGELATASLADDYLNVDENGVPYINQVSLENVKLENDEYLQIGPSEAMITKSPPSTVVMQELNSVASSSSINQIAVEDGGYMKINGITQDKLFQTETDELIIGGGGV